MRSEGRFSVHVMQLPFLFEGFENFHPEKAKASPKNRNGRQEEGKACWFKKEGGIKVYIFQSLTLFSCFILFSFSNLSSHFVVLFCCLISLSCFVVLFCCLILLFSAPREEVKPQREEGEGRGDKNKPPYVFKFDKRFNFKDFDPQNWSNWVPLLLALAAGYMLTHSSGQPRQISWQEFRINYLERGEVERLEVVNRSLVRVYLRRDSASQV